MSLLKRTRPSVVRDQVPRARPCRGCKLRTSGPRTASMVKASPPNASSFFFRPASVRPSSFPRNRKPQSEHHDTPTSSSCEAPSFRPSDTEVGYTPDSGPRWALCTGSTFNSKLITIYVNSLMWITKNLFWILCHDPWIQVCCKIYGPWDSNNG